MLPGIVPYVIHVQQADDALAEEQRDAETRQRRADRAEAQVLEQAQERQRIDGIEKIRDEMIDHKALMGFPAGGASCR